jgi:CRP/FNR family transcriptional regulator, cyclic AMP receptor protein
MPETSTPVAGTIMLRVLDEDRDLASALSAAQLERARLRALSPFVSLQRGDWEPPSAAVKPGGDLGLLVLSGLLSRNMELAGRTFSELRGPEDLLRPWDDAAEVASLRGRTTWTVLEPTRIAWLDGEFASAVAPWPEITSVLLERAVRRARLLSVQLAILELDHIHLRVLLLLWHLSDRWGRVRPEGVCLDLRLTHTLLARMVGAHRSSVTLAIQRLTREQRLTRTDTGAWLLLGGPPDELTDTDRSLAPARGLKQTA